MWKKFISFFKPKTSSGSSEKTPFWKRIFKPKEPKEDKPKRKLWGRKKAPTVPEPVYITSESPEELKAEAELQRIKDMIDEAQTSSYAPSAAIMILNSCERLDNILTDAENRYTPLEIMQKLRNAYGGSLERLTNMIDALIFAVYNKGNSGFAIWSGRGARARWEAELDRIRTALA